MFYLETLDFNGQPCPELHAEKPEIANGRIKKPEGIGPRVVPGTMFEVPAKFQGIPLGDIEVIVRSVRGAS